MGEQTELLAKVKAELEAAKKKIRRLEKELRHSEDYAASATTCMYCGNVIHGIDGFCATCWERAR